MNSFASPGTMLKLFCAQSASACSIRSWLDDTQFHQM